MTSLPVFSQTFGYPTLYQTLDLYFVNIGLSDHTMGHTVSKLTIEIFIARFHPYLSGYLVCSDGLLIWLFPEPHVVPDVDEGE